MIRVEKLMWVGASGSCDGRDSSGRRRKLWALVAPLVLAVLAACGGETAPTLVDTGLDDTGGTADAGTDAEDTANDGSGDGWDDADDADTVTPDVEAPDDSDAPHDSGTPQDSGTPPPTVVSNLYMITSSDPTLYAVDMATGVAGKVGPGLNGSVGTEFLGLAPGRTSEQLYAGDAFDLVSLGVDGAGFVRTEADMITEGAAYDPDLDVLFGTINGFLYTRSPDTGERLENWASPSNSLDVEGLAFDPETRTLFALIRGAEQQPQFNDIWFALYAMAVDEEPKEWSAVGSTDRLWANAGLAFDLDERVLYAIGSADEPGVLFRIDPETAATTKVGPTGVAATGWGLAWQKE